VSIILKNVCLIRAFYRVTNGMDYLILRVCTASMRMVVGLSATMSRYNEMCPKIL